MGQTIGNPLTWGAKTVVGIGHSVHDAAAHVGSENHVYWRVHALHPADIAKALRLGLNDAIHFRSDIIMLALIYPVVGLILTFAAFDLALLPMLFPLAAGFTLLGPVFSIGFYELSRRRENGKEAKWSGIREHLKSRSVGPVLVLGLYLLAVFILWMGAAIAVYNVTMGPDMPASADAFVTDVFTTLSGWSMIALGMGVGFVFAAMVLWSCSISFAMLVDKPVGVLMAVTTSTRLARKNPLVLALWGLTAAGLVAAGIATLFLGLVFVVPVLGHSTWHFYRLAISYD